MASISASALPIIIPKVADVLSVLLIRGPVPSCSAQRVLIREPGKKGACVLNVSYTENSVFRENISALNNYV